MEYLAANPSSPFKEYLPLLAADRWLCAAEGYDYEKRPKDAARSRRASDAAIQTARRSTALIVSPPKRYKREVDATFLDENLWPSKAFVVVDETATPSASDHAAIPTNSTFWLSSPFT
jgi:hypothetical protein